MRSRRQFLVGSGAAALGLTLPGCDSPPPERYGQADIDLLARQRALEEQTRGRGPYGPHIYQGYRGLAQLPWFDLDANGFLCCTDDEVPYSIDVHCHLGMSVLFRPHLDLLATTPRVKHLLDCDGSTPGCPLDLDTYINGNFSEQALDDLTMSTLAQGLWGSEFAQTQTIPKLVREMDAMRVQHAMLLPIKLGLPFGDQLSKTGVQPLPPRRKRSVCTSGFQPIPMQMMPLSKCARVRLGADASSNCTPPFSDFIPTSPR